MNPSVIARGAVPTPLLLVPFLLVPPGLAAAKSYYVSASIGSNSHSGLSASAPLKTIQYAEGLTNPGDTVYIMSGTYSNASPGANVFVVSRSGTAAAPITYTAFAGAHVVLSVSDS